MTVTSPSHAETIWLQIEMSPAERVMEVVRDIAYSSIEEQNAKIDNAIDMLVNGTKSVRANKNAAMTLFSNLLAYDLGENEGKTGVLDQYLAHRRSLIKSGGYVTDPRFEIYSDIALWTHTPSNQENALLEALKRDNADAVRSMVRPMTATPAAPSPLTLG